jgi:hypothetical protein
MLYPQRPNLGRLELDPAQTLDGIYGELMGVLAIACQRGHCRLTAVIFIAILPTVARSSFVRRGRVVMEMVVEKEPRGGRRRRDTV